MKLKLGGKWWDYKTSRKLTASSGYCDSAKQKIVVDARLDELQTLDVQIHEMIHACDTGNMIDEQWVRQTGTELAEALWKLGYRKEA